MLNPSIQIFSCVLWMVSVQTDGPTINATASKQHNCITISLCQRPMTLWGRALLQVKSLVDSSTIAPVSLFGVSVVNMECDYLDVIWEPVGLLFS